jgi:hypothetical protein
MSIEALEEITSLFENKGIDYWLFGGYALDAAVGRITREHRDTDFIIKIDDAGKAKLLLEKNDYDVDYVKDKLVARKGLRLVNLVMLEEFKGDYVIPALNIDAHVPKMLMNNAPRSELEGRTYRRVPNEVLYLFMRYSPNSSDVVIVKNLSINKDFLKKIKIVVKKR